MRLFWRRFATMLLLAALPAIGAAMLSLPARAAQADDKASIEDVKKQTEDLLRTLKGYSAAQRDAALEKIRASLSQLDRRIDELETRIDANWDEMDKTARAQARSSLRALRKQREKVAERYGGLQASSASAWDHMKKGFSDAYQALHDAWEKSAREFGGRE